MSISAFCYPATGIIGELDPNMIGIGYTLPFQTLVTEKVNAEQLADAMNGLGLEGVSFRPIHLKPYYMAKKGEALQGIQIHFTDLSMCGLPESSSTSSRRPGKLIPDFDPFQGKGGQVPEFRHCLRIRKVAKSP